VLDRPLGRLLDAFFEGGDEKRLARVSARQPLPQAQLAPSGEDWQGDEVDGGGHLKSGLKWGSLPDGADGSVTPMTR